MDELTIGDKIYISSKRAAKVTGYAKDYIGQLCREGRVEARLVGRSWYVLESAIREHRFGVEATRAQVATDSVEPEMAAPTAVWEAPRYVSEPEVPLIPILTSEKPLTTVPQPAEAPTPAVSMMQDAWKEWFETRENSLASSEEKVAEDDAAALPDLEPQSIVESQKEEVTAVRATDMSNEYNTFEVSRESASIPESYEEEPESIASFDEEERVALTIKRPERPAIASPIPRAHVSGGVIDLSRAAPAPRVMPNARVNNSNKKVPRSRAHTIQAVLLAIAGMAFITALIGSGVTDAFLAQQGIDNSVRGHVFDFVRGESEIKK